MHHIADITIKIHSKKLVDLVSYNAIWFLNEIIEHIKQNIISYHYQMDKLVQSKS